MQLVKQFPWDYALSPGENVKISALFPANSDATRQPEHSLDRGNNTQQGVPKISFVFITGCK